jgi:hypothetical protein
MTSINRGRNISGKAYLSYLFCLQKIIMESLKIFFYFNFRIRLQVHLQTVERANGHLKGRFRRLQCIHCTDAEKVCRLIMAACVWHNLCILTDDDILSFIDMDR